MRYSFLCAALIAASAANGAPVRPLVAVIDSGVARTAHLQGVLVGEYDMAASPPRPAFLPRYDHGTMVATILTREAKGQVDIVSFRIDDPAGCPAGLNPPCQSSAAPVASAIRKATALGVKAINLSLTLQDDPAIIAAIRDAAAQGVTVVMAAGNDGRDRPANLDMAIAGAPRTIVVGAVDAAGHPWARSNQPGQPNGFDYVWRLGVDVPTETAAGRPVVGTGTSFAAPIETARRLLQEAGTVATAAKEQPAPAGKGAKMAAN